MLEWTKVKLPGKRAFIYTCGEYEVSQQYIWGVLGSWRACLGSIVFSFPHDSALDAMSACDAHAMKTITNRLLGVKP